MENKTVGYLLIVIAVLMGFIIFSFNSALTNIVNDSCTHGVTCPMWGTINFETSVSSVVLLIILIVGVYFAFFYKERTITITKTKTRVIRQQIEPKEITKENYQKVLSTLDEEEKMVLNMIIESKGTIFQSDLVIRTNLNKVKVTRVLDKLEGREIIERKRRGMTNVVILKH
ncbi:MAG: MarR family transcriptional regulator [Candidatus Micrarchaeota archaeon]